MKERIKRFVDRGLIRKEELAKAEAEAEITGTPLHDVLVRRKMVPKHEVLLSMAESFNLPFVEYDEKIAIPQKLLWNTDPAIFRTGLWCPISLKGGRAVVVACDPKRPGICEEVKDATGASEVEFCVALPSDLARIIENSLDINPAFPPSAGRTPLAKVRTFFAGVRSSLACQRTHLARGRTGLAFLRTGLSFIAIGLLLLRIFGMGWSALASLVLIASGGLAVYDGLKWYLPARRAGKDAPKYDFSESSTWGTTVLEAKTHGGLSFSRTSPIDGAETLRHGWKDLSPVMRRRFLASDRTDMAEERTKLAYYRTIMAKARTGLAFTRTGIAFAGLGVTLIRQFKAGPWMALDISLILIGTSMALEGFHWYFPGRTAGSLGKASVDSSWGMKNIWDIFFPPSHKGLALMDLRLSCIPVKAGQSPGIWATTGLALERTVLADRRNVMARIRTLMARSRTGLALVRTGMAAGSIGLGLLVYFGTGNIYWAVFDFFLITGGLALITDGLLWHIPADRTRRQFPYCGGQLEITVPDYGRPASTWGKAVFSNDGE